MKKIAVACALLLLAGGAGWLLVASDDDSRPKEPAGPSVLAPPTDTRDATLAALPPNAKPLVADALPPSIALDAPGVIDRDRDVHGVVVREDGTPIGGADVAAIDRPWTGATLLGSGSWWTLRTVAATRSASDGTFALRLERGAAPRLRVSAPGLAPFEAENVGAGERLRVVLRPGVRLAVVAKDAEGAPVAGADLRLYRLGGATTWGYVRESYVRVGTTDAAGTSAFESLPAGEGGTWTMLVLEIDRATVATRRVEIPRSGEATVEIRLLATRALSGRVVDAETQTPIAGAVVGVGWEQQPRATTDAEGRYVLALRSDAKLMTVYADAEGHAFGSVDDARRDGPLDVALTRSAIVRGRLVDAAGAPVADATLTAHGAMGGKHVVGRAASRSGSDGRFELVGLSRTTTSEVWIEAKGFGRRGLALDAIGPSGAKDLGDLVLGAAHRVEGRVLDQEGKPLAGVFLQLSGGSAEQTRFWTGAERAPARRTESRASDDLGRFRFGDVAPGDYALTAQARGQAEQKQRVVVADADLTGLEFSMRSGRTLVVHVRAPDGTPAAYSSVELRLPDGSKHQERGADRLEFTVPDEDVSLRVVGMKSGQQAPEALVVSKGTDEVTITLVAADDWTVEGALLDAGGAPIPRAHLDAVSDAPQAMRTGASTGSDGRFALRLRGGTRATVTVTGLEVAASADGTGTTSEADFEADPVEVARGAKDVVIRARRVARDQILRVLVLDPDGRPLSNIPMNLQLQQASGGRFVGEGATGADGVVEFRGVVGKRVEVHRGSGVYTIGETWTDPFVDVVPAGQAVEYRFAAGTIVRGVVLGPDGTAAANAAISGTCRNRWVARASAVTRADGSFAFPLDAKTQLPLVLTARRGSDGGPVWSGRLVLDEMPAGLLTIRVAPPPITEK